MLNGDLLLVTDSKNQESFGYCIFSDNVHRPVSVLRQWREGGSSNMKLLRYRDQGGNNGIGRSFLGNDNCCQYLNLNRMSLLCISGERL